MNMTAVKEFQQTLSFSIQESEPILGTEAEVTEILKSLPIPNRERYLKDLDHSVRLIKGIKVLKEGVFNGVKYPESVVVNGAPTWMEHEKLGMTRKVNLDHTDSVKDRCGHIVKSYSEDGWAKQDFLLLRTKKENDAIDLWDAGLLDDVSVRMRVGLNMKNSTRKQPLAKYIRGVSTDFVDRPACKTCGLDAILSEMEENDADSQTEVEKMAQANEINEEESQHVQLDEESQKGIASKVFDMIKNLGKDKEEEDESLEDETDEKLCGGSQNAPVSKKKKKGTEEEEEMSEEEEDLSEDETDNTAESDVEMKEILQRLKDNEEKTAELSETISAQAQTIETQAATITALSEYKENTEAEKTANLQDAKVTEVAKYMKLCNEEFDIKELKESSMDKLDGMLFGLKLKAKDIPRDEIPLVTNSVIEDAASEDDASLAESKEKINKLNEQLKEKSPNAV